MTAWSRTDLTRIPTDVLGETSSPLKGLRPDMPGMDTGRTDKEAHERQRK